MTSTSNNVVLTAPGRLELVKNTNQRIPVDLTHVLPDGTRLTDPANEPLLNTILGVVQASEPRSKGASLSRVTSALFLLVQWMFLRSIYRFGALREHHYREHLEDASKGLDHCIQATPRMRHHLDTLRGMRPSQRKALRTRQVFADARIPATYVPRLPATTSLLRAFIKHGDSALDSLPSAKTQAHLRSHTLMTRASVIQMLWTLSSQLDDPASVEPYPNNVALVAHGLGTPKQQTQVVPHAVAIKMMVGAMETLMTIGPAFIGWDSGRSDFPTRSLNDDASFSQFQDVVKRTWGRNLVRHARGAVRPYVVACNVGRTLLPVACQVAIAAHMGKRKTEVETLDSNCIKGSADEGHHLSAYIAKRQTYESRPCPDYVVRAVQLMNMYQRYGPEDQLPLFRKRGKRSMMRAPDYINVFADVVGAREYVDGHGHKRVWHWHFHQLRRLYVVIYVWRYEDASLLALRHHLGHGHEKESAYYARLASDENYADLMSEVGVFTLEKLRELSGGGSERIVGTFADVVTRRIERAKAQLRTTSERSLESVLSHLVEKEGLTLHAGPWGFCGCRPIPSNLRRAQCIRKQPDRERHPIFNTPIPENSEEETCGSCHFHCSSSSREPHWRAVVMQLDRAIAGGDPNSLAVQVLHTRREKVNEAANRMFGPKGERSGAGQREQAASE